MSSPWDLRVYTSMPTWVVAMGIKHDVEVHDGGAYWELTTATANNGIGFTLVLHKDLVHRAGKPVVYQDRGLIEIKFKCELYAEEWVTEMRDDQLVEMVKIANKPGAELASGPPTPIKARTCCQTFENELHAGDCKDYITGRGVVATFDIDPPVARAEPHANLCSRCWNHYYGTGTGRPCGECKP